MTTASPDTTISLSDRLAALKDRMGPSSTGAEGSAADSLTSQVAQLDDQQGHLLSLVASLTEDVQELAPRLVAELQELLPGATEVPDLTPRLDALDERIASLAEVVTENADTHEATIGRLQAALPKPVETVDLTPRIERLELLLTALTEVVTESADAHKTALAGIELPAAPEVPDLTPRLETLETLVRSLAMTVGESILEQTEQTAAQTAAIGAVQDSVTKAAVDPTPRLEVLEDLLRSHRTIDHTARLDALESLVLRQQQELREELEEITESQARAIAAVHEHVDAAALAVVEAILSAR